MIVLYMNEQPPKEQKSRMEEGGEVKEPYPGLDTLAKYQERVIELAENWIVVWNEKAKPDPGVLSNLLNRKPELVVAYGVLLMCGTPQKPLPDLVPKALAYANYIITFKSK